MWGGGCGKVDGRMRCGVEEVVGGVGGWWGEGRWGGGVERGEGKVRGSIEDS